MALTSRQQKHYIHRADIWRKSRNASGDFTYEKVMSSVPCYFYSTSNVDAPTPVGLIKKDLAIMLDYVHFEAKLDIRSQDYIQNVTPGHPDRLTWYSGIGEPQVRASAGSRKANRQRQYINKTDPPPGVDS